MPSFSRNLFGSVDSMMDFDTGATPNEGTFIFLTLEMRNPPP